MKEKNVRKKELINNKKSNALNPLFPYPALLINNEEKKTLVITDLHIGFEHALTQEGIYLPSQTSKISDKLIQILRIYEPEELIIIGDVKQAIPKISLREWTEVPRFFETITKTIEKVSIVLGNHDGNLEPLIPPSIKIIPSNGLVIGKKIGLFHGHSWPRPDVLASKVLIMGHIHPIIRIFDSFGFAIVRQVWMKIKCNGKTIAKAYLKYSGVKEKSTPKEQFYDEFATIIKDPVLIILPAFNDALGGMPVNQKRKKLLGPILKNCEAAIGTAELYLLDGTYLSTVNRLPTNF